MGFNKIDARIASDQYTNDYLAIHIDGVPLDIFLFELTQVENYKGLVPAWLPLDNENEQEYIWEIFKRDSIVGVSLPVLICPDDMDFSCTVIVAKVIYTEDEVIWDRIGIVNRSNWNITEWRKSGIRNTGSWSVDDWNMYGDRFNLHDLWDSQWEGWISNNWKEEETRRLCDYVHQYFNKEENVDWFHNIPKLVFGKEEYQKCIEKFYERLCR